MRRFDVLGTSLVATTYDEFTLRCQALARGSSTSAVDFSNTHIVTMRRHDPSFRDTTSGFDFFIPDGMPLIWCLNRQGAGLRDRVYGPTFMRHFTAHSPAPFRHYLLGGSVECLQQLQDRLRAQQPQLNIVGARTGYFRSNQEAEIVDEINQLAPDFIWIGLGTPKQQLWVERNRSKIRRGVLFTVGFAFDVNAGTKRDAPDWMQRNGLTWLYRLVSEPRRLFFRYLRYNSLFLYYLIKDAIVGRQVI